jgi:PPK2 family polyphosphate:nucleotide phosphotransferase
MRIQIEEFRVGPKLTIDLGKWPTGIKPIYKSKRDYRECISEHVAGLSAQQDLFYANHRYSLLLIFQGMDAAGKDGAIKHVMSGVNPQGCQVVSFKQPSAAELGHDFLWRTTRHLPERGMIGIFNRSYYEEVLVARVHPKVLAAENIPPGLIDKKTIWEERFRSIVDLERHLTRSGTTILKFFLHISKTEQRKRFLERIDDPNKSWKFTRADVHERKYWARYRSAYEACIGETSTVRAPWYVVPADDKDNARLIVSQVILETFRGLKMSYPHTTREGRKELARVRRSL